MFICTFAAPRHEAQDFLYKKKDRTSRNKSHLSTHQLIFVSISAMRIQLSFAAAVAISNALVLAAPIGQFDSR
jgi:hypothetical protein